METTETVNVKKSRQVRITFEGLDATVNVKDSDEIKSFNINDLDDNIKTELLKYGWKQKVSDYRASDKLQGADKLEAIDDCHNMLLSGEFTQKRESTSVPLAEQIEAFGKLSEDQKKAIELVSPNLFKKLNK